MRWKQEFLDEIQRGLAQLGALKGECQVCAGAGMNIGRLLVILTIGGISEKEPPPRNILFAVMMTECSVCGHIRLFNSERFRTGGEPVLETA